MKEKLDLLVGSKAVVSVSLGGNARMRVYGEFKVEKLVYGIIGSFGPAIYFYFDDVKNIIRTSDNTKVIVLKGH